MSRFHFQRFSVLQERSGMRICTDATVFGAMMPIAPGDRVLDIGTGTGLLALMAAQLGAGSALGVELTQAAHAEACENFRASPWSDRLRALHQDFRRFAASAGADYDLLISNPPFFQHHSKTRSTLRKIARHADSLPYADLIAGAERCLAPNGLFYVLLPSHAVESFAADALRAGLYLLYRTDYCAYPGYQAKVCALTFHRADLPTLRRSLTLYRAEREYAAHSRHYLAPFLLRFAADKTPIHPGHPR